MFRQTKHTYVYIHTYIRIHTYIYICTHIHHDIYGIYLHIHVMYMYKYIYNFPHIFWFVVMNDRIICYIFILPLLFVDQNEGNNVFFWSK